MASEPQYSLWLYGDCGSCSALDAPVECPCLATHYCDKECQKKDKKAHRTYCTHLLRRDFDAKCQALLVLKEEGHCCASDVAAKEEELGWLHNRVGELLRFTQLASNYELAEEHYKQALKISRRLAALAKLSRSSCTSNKAINAANSISTPTNSGNLYSRWHNKNGHALQAYEDALDSLRDCMSAHGSTPHCQNTLSSILSAQVEVHIQQHERQGSGPDTERKYHAAQALVEEALAFNRALNAQADKYALDLTAEPNHPLNQANRQDRTGRVLLEVAVSYADLEMFEQAQGAMHEALDLYSRCYGSESENVVICHNHVANIFSQQAIAIKTSIAQSSSLFARHQSSDGRATEPTAVHWTRRRRAQTGG